MLMTENMTIMLNSITSAFGAFLYFVSLKVSVHYLGATNMMFVAGLMMAVAVEHCGLHHRFPITIIRMSFLHQYFAPGLPWRY